ncbi:MAG: hypothetical protein K2H17_06220 [Duncaniella sp.]|uniref:hypothetical protein n=1 Tax=Duncaniella sp. TaxID=2518496 RepID=UPI0023C7516B|nr:hypothetical protein [Duncaniella sp.]MDE5988975.1 hypothetical protein [Duncaniella sp.]
MQLIIDGKYAVLKKGSSFDYVSENRSFSDADDYTLSITLPLADCPENLDIFGHVDRMDIDSRHIVLEASIVDRAFSKNGIITVVEATEIEVKCQFLEGRSVQNFLTTLDDVYINELPLGSYPTSNLPQSTSTYLSDFEHGANQVALPWVYDDTGMIQNEMIYDADGNLVWSQFTKDTGKLSFQPYLIFIAKQICRAIGYSFDFSQWENSPEANLLVCNALPAAWDIPKYARALPHWSVSEFFDELEKILVCEINIDHKTKQIGMVFCDNVEWSENEICLQNVVDSFSSDISYDDDLCQFKGVANLRYSERSDSKWKLEQCQWLIDLLKQEGKYYKEFQTLEDFFVWETDKFGLLGPGITGKDHVRGSDVGQLIHIISTDQYALWKVIYGNISEYPNMYFYKWVDLNRFGDVINDPNSDNDIELSCVPVRVDETDNAHGLCLFLAPSGFNEKEDLDEAGIRQPMAYSALLKGAPDSAAEYYDKLYLAYWDGHSANEGAASYGGGKLPPCPYVDERFSLKRRYRGYFSGMKVSPREKLKVSWIGDSIPDVRSVFFIRGKRYLCEKITVTFTEIGMSQLLKGEFYPLIDD